ncbi:MAG TPA: Rpn family recombination-promoting nuclease/putative transposase [Thermotogota bacterium]|jgi:hypothetical protein|nr:MAG: hypothetical protein BWX67_02168 [Thermotogota bacterium ADurb.Bin062]HOF24494.1 Rpn family recombination-promoting nuclease/putative transposase [Thermotogota bacterium]HPL39865.1 Rpn family recombination-promoting nuclease/putative transposase [Thermotogota bacterium]HRU38104.1 Rpn family recombination-promoting nuclease/putative transposase [Thermotogota bacterium]
MEKFYNPHDRFFKEVLGNVANTQAFLETYLPLKSYRLSMSARYKRKRTAS